MQMLNPSNHARMLHRLLKTLAVCFVGTGSLISTASALAWQNPEVSDRVLTSTPEISADSPVQGNLDSKTQPRWYKGNLHTHSLWSDGNNFPETIIAWYRDNDYQFLALTEHNRIAEGERWMSQKEIDQRSHSLAIPAAKKRFGEDWVELRGDQEAGTAEVRLKTLSEIRPMFESLEEFLLIQAEEITDSVGKSPVHMNATNLQKLILPAGGRTVKEAMSNNMRATLEQSEKTGKPILLHLNHPNFGWGVTADDLASVSQIRFFEAFNGHPGVNHTGDANHPSIEKLWDIANTLRLKKYGGKPVFGLGTDDSHHYFGKGTSRFGRGWVHVRATSLSSEALLEAFDKGDFYTSSGVSLKSLTLNDKTISVAIDADPQAHYVIQLIATPKDVSTQTTPIVDDEGQPIQNLVRHSDEIGKVMRTIEGTEATFTCQDDWLYARVVITSDQTPTDPAYDGQKQQAWLQPFGWTELQDAE